MISVLLWSVLTVLAVLLAVSFGYLFYRDRDKRKLMFMLAFVFASLDFLPKMQTGWESIQIMEKLYYWSAFPLISAILIAVLSSFLKLKDFDKPFKAFLFTLATSIFMMVAPLPVQPARSLLFQSMSMIVIVVSIYLILTRREISDIMFLLSMVCFISAGLGMARGSGVEFSVFAYVFAYVFIALVFVTSKEGIKGGIASFFALKKELEKTLEELKGSEEKYRTQFEEAMDAILLADAKTGIIVDCNRAASELVGRERSELVGKHQRVLHPPQEIEGEFSSTFKQHLKEKEGQVLETQVITKKGEIKDVEIKANVFELRGKKMIQGIFRDITERRKTEERIRESEEKYRNLFNNARDVILTFDLKGNVTSINTFAAEYGLKEDEIVGKSMLKFVPKIYWPRLLKELAKLARGNPTEGEIEIITPKGKRIGEYRANPIRRGKKVIGIQEILRDITERKRAEEALERQRDIAISLSGARDLSEALHRLFDNLLEIEEFDCAGFYLVDEDTRELDMIVHRGLPDSYVKKTSHFDADSPYTKVVMEGKPIYQKTSNFPPAIREDLQSEGVLFVAVIPIHYKGEIIGDLNLASYTCDEISAATRHVLESVGAQIGEAIIRVRMGEKLRESREKFKRLFMDNPEAAVYVDQDFHILDVNPRFEENFGYSLDEIKRKHINDVVVPKDKIEEAEMLDKKAQEEYVYHDGVRKRKDESLVPVSISAAKITVEDQLIGYVILYKDITERKQMEKKLEEYSQQLEKMVEKRTKQLKEAQEQLIKSERLAAIGEVATIVGHDLRNPLQSIENATYYLSNELPHLPSSTPIPQKTIEMLQIINNSVNYADNIIRDLQDFSAKKKPILKKTNINSVVKETLSQVETPENVKIATKLGHLPQIEADKDMMKRVFLNLTINGIQAMKNGGTLKISTKKAKGFVEVSIKDTGIGMSKENMEKLFTPFFTTKARGMGMGLPICKRFVESHGGSIQIESKEGKGSTFTVKLPIQQESGGEKQ